jgi:hypothetical protein
METTERIVEAYVRYVKGWATIPNIKCGGQKEIDLFAIDPKSGDRYHIETTVSISQSYRALTLKEFTPGEHKVRGKAAGARRKLGFFLKEKFDAPGVQKALASYGGSKLCKKIIVIWEWRSGAQEAAAAQGVELWDFRELMSEIAELGRHKRTYFGDDTLRTLTLFVKALDGRAHSLEPGSMG